MLRIMLIDDEPEIVSAMTACGEAQGIAVQGYTRASAAVAAFASDPKCCDCIVTDIYMPEMDGIELIRALRRISTGIPIVVATAHPAIRPNGVLALRAAQAFGANVVTQKPYGCKEILDLVNSILHLQTAGSRHI
jgi:CheY-like chemotaxis protein